MRVVYNVHLAEYNKRLLLTHTMPITDHNRKFVKEHAFRLLSINEGDRGMSRIEIYLIMLIQVIVYYYNGEKHINTTY